MKYINLLIKKIISKKNIKWTSLNIILISKFKNNYYYIIYFKYLYLFILNYNNIYITMNYFINNYI